MSETTEAEVKVEDSKVEESKVETPKVEEVKDPSAAKIAALEKDNFQQREELRLLKSQFAEFEIIKQELDQTKAEKAASAAALALNTALDEAKIVDEKARKLATSLLKDSTDYAESIKGLLEEYPFLTEKKTIPLPNTGKSVATDEVVPNSGLLNAGFAKLLNK